MKSSGIAIFIFFLLTGNAWAQTGTRLLRDAGLCFKNPPVRGASVNALFVKHCDRDLVMTWRTLPNDHSLEVQMVTENASRQLRTFEFLSALDRLHDGDRISFSNPEFMQACGRSLKMKVEIEGSHLSLREVLDAETGSNATMVKKAPDLTEIAHALAVNMKKLVQAGLPSIPLRMSKPFRLCWGGMTDLVFDFKLKDVLSNAERDAMEAKIYPTATFAPQEGSAARH